MPITLTTPVVIPAAHGKPGAPANEVKIVGFNCRLDTNEVILDVQLGNTVDDVWVSVGGQAGKATFIIDNKPAHLLGDGTEVDADDQYNGLVSENIATYNALAAALYGWLMDQDIYDGEIG